eukprot:jgi/Mesen1/10153/ME000076S09660
MGDYYRYGGRERGPGEMQYDDNRFEDASGRGGYALRDGRDGRQDVGPQSKRRRDFEDVQQQPRGTYMQRDRNGVFMTPRGAEQRIFDDQGGALRPSYRDLELLAGNDLSTSKLHLNRLVYTNLSCPVFPPLLSQLQYAGAGVAPLHGGMRVGGGGGLGGGNALSLGPGGGLLPDDSMMMGGGGRGVDVGLAGRGPLLGNAMATPDESHGDMLPHDASATLFVDGLPMDCTRREAARYRFDEADRESATLRLTFARNPGPRARDDGFRGGPGPGFRTEFRDDFAARGGGVGGRPPPLR